jgi:chemotaxis protein methyltransferase CheR
VSNDAAFKLLQKKIYEKTGIDCSLYKDNYLKRRIDLRMKVVGVGTSYNEYYRYLGKNPAEYDAILDGITINVTEFFRDITTFDAFKNEVLPQVLADKKKRKSKIIRIWSAACSIGEEPYTIGIILHEKLGPEINNFLISIQATDLDAKALNVAKAGIYDASALKKLKKYMVSKYFDAVEDGKYRIKNNVKHLVRFQQHDLISGRKFSHFDIIFCRNVLIYFGKELQSQLFLDFYDALSDGGYLIIGRTETLTGEAREKLLCVNTRERVYRKGNSQIFKNSKIC